MPSPCTTVARPRWSPSSPQAAPPPRSSTVCPSRPLPHSLRTLHDVSTTSSMPPPRVRCAASTLPALLRAA
ncbi:hypothetical protein BDA96_03G035600 [Sorghum bicolor]|nr:hypothetical protein BDA96_09G184200 [Sorghum bicolor]KAG0527197.1 hypothetical protein BDA96_06G212300 [Sorghum bicolor]KAG0536100.1 hypothetical protein BDA96_03G035600 [Sorghum bicolor]